ncbi:ABC transporter ATP-binding protein [Salinicoccus hispanicus]|uniref:ATP-binding cassette domain-containing protein n=1 Tax=Salinicoccus hispanicus TaxID=157225 RepID=A0A6N8U3B6_9STAP|nr:ABC transporter ATP-binding protein [Salinicoccus hispanicus]MXQ50179.1 ATP-binding cassette domain-containing protein [Salinicoccus hispanicus]
MNAITVTGLDKNMGGFKLESIDMNIRKGYITGLIGENGAGKSTVINHMLGLKKQDAGRINILDKDLEAERTALLNSIGLVFAEDRLPQNVTPVRLSKLLRTFYDQWDKETFFSYLKTFNVNMDRRIKYLSTGEKVKLSIAIALSHKAELLILDEPTSNLDPTFRMELLEILQELMIDEEITILFSTHITSDLDKIADYIIMIDDGKIIFEMEKETLFETYRKVKGSKALLDDETKSLLIGATSNALGFEGMSKEYEAFKELYGNKVIIESLTIDEIMYYIKKEKRGFDNV